jgi:hypothetical protein
MSSSLLLVHHGLFHQIGTTPVIPLKPLVAALVLQATLPLVARAVVRIQN